MQLTKTLITDKFIEVVIADQAGADPATALPCIVVRLPRSDKTTATPLKGFQIEVLQRAQAILADEIQRI